MRAPVSVERVFEVWSLDIGLETGEENLLVLFIEDAFCAEWGWARLGIRHLAEKVDFVGVFGDFVEDVQAKWGKFGVLR